MIFKINSSLVFALQLDETTDVSNFSQLLVYIRYVADEGLMKNFCQPLKTTSKAADVFHLID